MAMTLPPDRGARGKAGARRPEQADTELDFAAAVALHQSGRLKEAIARYWRVIACHPGHVSAHLNLGAALQGLGKLDAAVKSYRRALALQPDNADAHEKLGAALHMQGSIEDAIASYRRALALKPDHAEIHGNLGVALQALGRLDEAIESYRRVIALKPDLVEAHIKLGAALHMQGKLAAAAACHRRALALRPGDAVAHDNLGTALQAQGRLDEAIASYRSALALKPDYAEAHNHLGAALQMEGKLEEAIASYRRALALKPDYAQAHNNLGVALYRLGKLDEAVASYTCAIALAGDYAEAHNNLGVALYQQGKLDQAAASHARAIRLKPDYADAHSNLGTAMQGQGRAEEAVASFRRALALAPHDADAHRNLGNALQAVGRLEDAAESYRRAIAANPTAAESHNNLGTVLQALDRVDEAIASYRHALAVKPDYADALNNLGAGLLALGRLDEAIESYRRALALKPDVAWAHHNLGTALLLLGDFAAGTAEYEWRWRVEGGARLPSFAQPLWDGQHLSGGTVLLWSEQGFGDAIQFARYAKLVRARCNRVLLQCPPALMPLFETVPGVDQVIAMGETLPAFDAHAPLMSLMRILETRLETIPAEVPYVAVDPERVARMRERIGEGAGLKVGLVWAGNPNFKGDRDRSLASLSLLEPLLGVEGVTFFSLQKGARAGEIAALGLGDRIVDLGPVLDDLADTAAAISEFDLVISTCTSVPHLAGALGKEVWTLLSFSPHWIYPAGQDDCPWYPSMRLFRQKARGDWPGVIARVAGDLRRMAASHEIGEWARHGSDQESGDVASPGDAMAADVAFSRAVALHQSGELDEAAAQYRRVVGLNPTHVFAHNYLGLAFQSKGRLDEALASYARALALKPDYAEAQGNLGTALQALGKLDEARESYRRALELKQDYAEAHNNLGTVLRAQGRVEDAMASYRRALELKPDYPEAHNNLGLELQAQGRLEEALASYARAVALKPDYAEAHNYLGTALQVLGKLDEAMASYRRALSFKPDHADAHNNVGAVLQMQGKAEEAIENYRRALALRPDHAGAYSNLGVALEALDRLDEAMESYRHALALKPDNPEAHKNLGTLLQRHGRLEEAIESYRRAIALKPDFAWAHHNLGTALLILGDFAAGAAEYEWRWRMMAEEARPASAGPSGRELPMWDGRPLPGGTILLRAEQGLGDAIQFARYAKLVRARCDRVLLLCHPPLAGLLETVPGVDQVIARGETLPAFDAHAPLLSLMRIFETRLQTIPAEVPYVAADPERVARLRKRIANARGLKVGLVWAGNPEFPDDRNRSLASLSLLEPLLGVEGVTFFSLQKGARAGEIAALGLGDRIVDLGPVLDDLADTAAAISELDLVISTCTSVPHLAGALGKEVWTLLSFSPHWIYPAGQDDCPWYPSMRLFRQKARGDWPGVIARVTDELRRLAQHGTASHDRRDSRNGRTEPRPVASGAGQIPRDQDAFIEAVRHHQAGRLPEAETIYRRILEATPDHVGALHYLGVAACQRGDYGVADALIGRALAVSPNYSDAHNSLGTLLKGKGALDQARASFERAVALKPANAEAHGNLGTVLLAQGRVEDAIACFRRALVLKPDHADTHSNLGTAFQAKGNLEEAAASYRRALALKADHVEALTNLGAVLHEQAKLDEAAALLRQALALSPDHPEAHSNLGLVLSAQGAIDDAKACLHRALALKPDHPGLHTNLGGVLKKEGKLNEAVACFERALALNPHYAEAHVNLGATLQAQGKFEEAMASCHRALAARPDHAEALSNLGTALQALGRMDEAMASYRHALAVKPSHAAAHSNLGAGLQALGRLDEAIESYRRALALKPDYGEVHSNLGMALLSLGDFAAGTAEYEWRWRVESGARLPSLAQPLWDGRKLPGGTVLLWSEQGLGDAIQFARYVKLVRARCDRVLLLCQPPLARLFETVPGVDQVIKMGEMLPAFDAHAPLMSLMRILETRLETIPAEVPYLAADPERAARLRERMGAGAGLKVGLVWAGNPDFKGDRTRSLASLSLLEPLLGVEGVSFFSLQKGARAGEIAELGFNDRIVDLGPGLDDFADTAAAINELDLVISTCTSVPHLAGALGKEAWTLLSFSAHWIYLARRDDCPWYPSMRLFRQKVPGDWPGVIARVADELRHYSRQNAPVGTAKGRNSGQSIWENVKEIG